MTDLPLEGKSFLVVDDERFTRELVSRLLRYLGAGAVWQAEQGRMAMRMLSGDAAGADAVIADLNMPIVNGLALLKAIRSGTVTSRRDLPVVVLTGNSDTGLVARALELDVNGFIVKPVSQGVLAQRLERAFAEERVLAPAAAYAEIDTRLDPSEPDALAYGDAPPRTVRALRRRIPLEAVEDGQILAEEVRLSTGQLLIPAGTKLSRRLATKLIDLRDLNEPIAFVTIAVPLPA